MAKQRRRRTSQAVSRDTKCVRPPRGVHDDLTPAERARLETLKETFSDLPSHSETEMLKVALPSSIPPNEKNRIFGSIVQSIADDDGTFEHRV